MGKKNKSASWRKNKNGNGKNNKDFNDKETLPVLTNRVKKTIVAICLFVLAIIVAFSFWQKSGSGGEAIFKVFNFLVGQAVYVLPFLLFFNRIFDSTAEKTQDIFASQFCVGALHYWCFGYFSH